MSKKYLYLLLMLVLLAAVFLLYALRENKTIIEQYDSINRPPAIQPDYTDTVIPPNIAPLNFLIQEKGERYYVKIYSKQGDPIEVFSKTPRIDIPKKHWQKLLTNNKNQQLYFDVFVKNEDDKWNRFAAITNKIAEEEIDKFVVYRKIPPVHTSWRKMGIYQRNLQNYKEATILDNSHFESKGIAGGCLNCHTFCGNNTDKMLIGIRSVKYGSSAILADNGVAGKIGTKFGYTAWHPSGRMVTYSINKIRQSFNIAKNEIRNVIDFDSLLAYYTLGSKTIKTTPQLSDKTQLETYPAWSPDGRYLYFCRPDGEQRAAELFNEVKYSLLRISYDIQNDKWGQIETVLSAEKTGLSILIPRISPDGRWLLFAMCDYGPFPVYMQSSDLYLIDLQAAKETGQYQFHRLDINSDQSESWHSFSSNSRWIAFSSKRDYGKFTRTYFSYIDENGKVYKPLLMPQKDPTFYDTCLETYSVPELVITSVKVTGEKLGRVVRGTEKIDVDMPITMATPKPGQASDPWQLRE